MFNCKEEVEKEDACMEGGAKIAMVKVKDEELDGDIACHLESILDMSSNTFHWNIESVLSLAAASHEEEEKVAALAIGGNSSAGEEK